MADRHDGSLWKVGSGSGATRSGASFFPHCRNVIRQGVLTFVMVGRVLALAAQNPASASLPAKASPGRSPNTAPHHIVGAVSLRFIYLGMVAEVARHAGHADVLAEQIRADRR